MEKSERKKRDERFRNVVFTSFEMEEDPITFDEKISYLIFGHEVCPDTGKHHWQGYVEFAKQYSFNMVKSFFNDKSVHLEKRMGSPAQASDYCKKEGLFKEFGKISNPGERTDLQLIKDNVLNGGDNIYRMAMADLINDNQQLRFAENLMKYAPQLEREAPLIYWLYGKSGCGKTRMVYDKEGFNLFKIEPNCEWFDGYMDQEAVLFDDFRGTIPLHVLLQILDRYPVRLRAKGSFVNWRPKRIYITSSKSPDELYINCNDNIDQLLRRITKVIRAGADAPRASEVWW